MPKRRARAPDPEPFDYELIFNESGSVELRDSNDALVWSSDSDDDFPEEFDGDFFDDGDSEEILEYLDEKGLVDLESDIIEIVEIQIDDDADTHVVEGEFIPAPKRKK